MYVIIPALKYQSSRTGTIQALENSPLSWKMLAWSLFYQLSFIGQNWADIDIKKRKMKAFHSIIKVKFKSYSLMGAFHLCFSRLFQNLLRLFFFDKSVIPRTQQEPLSLHWRYDIRLLAVASWAFVQFCRITVDNVFWAPGSQQWAADTPRSPAAWQARTS